MQWLRPLVEGGLTQIGFSHDSFHGPYIPPVRVRNALLACQQLGLPATLKLVYTRTTASPAELLAQLGEDAIAGAHVQEIPCYPMGRALERVPAADLVIEPGIPQGPCPGAVFTVGPTGGAHFCCNGAGFAPPADLRQRPRGTVGCAPAPILYPGPAPDSHGGGAGGVHSGASCPWPGAQAP